MTDEEKRNAAVHYLAQLLSAKHCRKEQEARVRFHEHAAAVLGCPDLDKLTPTGRHHAGLAILRDIRAELLDEIQRNATELDRLLAVARISPKVEVVVHHRLDGWTWDKVAMKMCFSVTNVRRMERVGLLMVYELFIAPRETVQNAPQGPMCGDGE